MSQSSSAPVSQNESKREDPNLIAAVDAMNLAITRLLQAKYAGWANEVALVRNRAEKAGGLRTRPEYIGPDDEDLIASGWI